ncbi:unnamed protein product [Gongylonema pulchrum]|uniref:Uncharacterized protein n=1 Tax=Gongylonema pulchrum TaxID=637853 RepID=A0A3P7QJF1_9BILA|nr:unnamed protein product [Gongylonema pulchrum]
MGLIGLGIGRTMPWSLGIPMIDDNVSNKNLPAFFAPPGLTAKDPTWIGAWWMGYLFIGLILIVPSITLYFFPTR